MEPVIKVAPFVKGVSTSQRTIIRRLDAPSYLCLSADEFAVVTDLQENDTKISAYLARHLGGHNRIGFKAAIGLLVKLQQAEMIENSTDELQKKLDEVAGDTFQNTVGTVKKFLGFAVQALDLHLLSFEQSRIHPLLKSVGKGISSTPAIIAYVGIIVLFGITGFAYFPNPESVLSQFETPEIFILKTFFAFSVATSFLALLQLAALKAANCKYISGGIHLTCFFAIRLVVKDDDVFVLPRKKMLGYQAFSILAPWVLCLICWQIVNHSSLTSVGVLLSGAFMMIGIFSFCPLYRSPIVKIAEGYLATFHVMDNSNSYLSKGIFKNVVTGGKDKKHNDHDHTQQLWVTTFACISMAWLYGMFLLFADVLILVIPDLWAFLNPIWLFEWEALSQHPITLVRAVSVVLILVLLGLAMALPLFRLALIPWQNLAEVASLPIHKARRSIDKFNSKKVTPSDAVTNFLSEIPIFTHVKNETLHELVSHLSYRGFSSGQTIIKQNEIGEEFFILADGKAQVILEKPDGREQVLDILNPGDSFGEIALIEHCKRTATIRALSPCKTLILDRNSFDELFPEESEARNSLTNLLRQVKLILESQALSHLAPSQIRELLKNAKPMTLEAGEKLIEEGTIGDAAYLIETGNVSVMKEGYSQEKVATLSHGDLVGQVALIKDIPRTASVIAEDNLKVLKIDKETFMRMCMANIFVAMLVSDMSDSQISELEAG